MILIGDAVEQMQTLPEKSVGCCVTSPPYFGLRDYGMTGQIGLEETPEEYVAKLVDVFREVRRVLRDDGTLWLNLGDSYSGSGKVPAGNLGKKHNERHLEHRTGGNVPDGTKPKDLIGIPWMVAFALRADGWYLRQDIIWAKPNPMPESVTDRCTKSHEYLFLLTKSPRYYFDNEAIKEPTTTMDTHVRDRDNTRCNNTPGRTRMGGLKTNNYDKRNKRSVWTISTKPYKGAHFAVFPEALVEPCILAGCPKGGMVLDPFAGSGTSLAVAERLGRRAVGIELNPAYLPLIQNRLKKQSLGL